MSKITVLNQEEMISILDIKSVIEAVEDAYRFKSSGKAEVFPLICK